MRWSEYAYERPKDAPAGSSSMSEEEGVSRRICVAWMRGRIGEGVRSGEVFMDREGEGEV